MFLNDNSLIGLQIQQVRKANVSDQEKPNPVAANQKQASFNDLEDRLKSLIDEINKTVQLTNNKNMNNIKKQT